MSWRNIIDRWGAAAAILVLTAVAYAIRWDQDDAFISYRYVEHWASGLGPVWNEGQPVEGYTNFLWVLLLTLAKRAGAPVVETSHVLGVLSFAVLLTLTHRLATLVFSPRRALLALLLVGTNYTLLCYSTGGLETALNAALVTALLVQGARAATDERPPSRAQLALTSVVAALALMTRPDGVVAASVTFGFLGLYSLRFQRPAGARVVDGLSLVLPAALILVPWLLFKLDVYGSVLPNTFWVKMGVSTGATWLRGVVYVGLFLVSYWLWPSLLLLVLNFRTAFRGPWLFLGTFAGLWLGYVVRSGGDIMEFRQMVPVVTPLIFLAVHGTEVANLKPRWQWALIGLLPLGSLLHGVFFPRYVPIPGIGTIRGLEAQVSRDRADNWTALGRALAALFPSGARPTIAVSPAGAIPYYSGLRSIDVLGLNDAWVARHGLIRTGCRACAAHPRLATFDYLREAKVDLLIAHPIVTTDTQGDPNQLVRHMFYDEQGVGYETLGDADRLVYLPLSNGSFVVAVQLRPNEAVDRLIREGRLTAVPFHPTPFRPVAN